MNANHNVYHNLWRDGLICAFEFRQGRRKITKYNTSVLQRGDSPETFLQVKKQELGVAGEEEEEPSRSYWRPIGWDRLSELLETVKVDDDWSLQNIAIDHEDEATVAELAAPYWERPLAGPTWWCHVDASHQGIASWLRNALWLHPAVSVALRDESKLISERMKHIFYEVPVRVAGGLLFELLGQSPGDPFTEEDDIPIVLRSWQAQNFVVTALHVKGFASNITVLGITEVQEMLIAGGACIPKTIHELIAHLACRLARWDDRLSSTGTGTGTKNGYGNGDGNRQTKISIDTGTLRETFWNRTHFGLTSLHSPIRRRDVSTLSPSRTRTRNVSEAGDVYKMPSQCIIDDRLFRKYVFGAADEVELMFMNKRMYEDLNLFTVILNQEIRRLSTQVIRVKWSLHAREEIVFELLQQLKGNTTKDLLEGIRKSTRDMINEQEAVRGRLFTIQDVMQNTVRAWLQDRSLTVTHNLGIFGGVGLLLTIVTGLFGINVDGIPGAGDSPQAFALFSAILFFSGLVLVVGALLYLGLKEPKVEENVEIRKLELDEMVKKFQREAESHAQVCKKVPQNIERTSSSSRMIVRDPNGYVLIE